MNKYLQWFFAMLLIATPIAFAEQEHDHASHEHASGSVLQIEWGLKGAQEAINIHPLFVHFPIALLLAAIALYLAGSIFKKETLLMVGKWNLLMGALSAIVTVWTGFKAAETVAHGGGTHQMMMAHQYLGFTVLVLSIGLSLWVFLSRVSIPGKGKGIFLALLVVMGGLLVQGADLGGRMVFLNGVGVGRKSMMQELTGHEHGEQGYHEGATEEAGHDDGGQDHGSHAH